MIIAPHPDWEKKFEQTLVPETFVEVTMSAVDPHVARFGSQQIGTKYALTTSNVYDVLGLSENVFPENFATLEENLWVLDGTKKIRPTLDSLETGFVGAHDKLDDPWSIHWGPFGVTPNTIPGFTIVWSSEYGEYPTSFSVKFENSATGDYGTIVFENSKIKTVDSQGMGWDSSKITLDNSVPHVFKVDGEFARYDRVWIYINDWNTPNHRPRLDRLVLGYNRVFGKKDIFSFTHEQTADVISAELPKNSITFSLDNTDGKWNPHNPDGVGKYLADRQIVTVRYGLDVNSNGNISWIPGGTFYLSEWQVPANGLEATFTARDPFEFMISVPYNGHASGTLEDIVNTALFGRTFPNEIELNVNSQYKNQSVTIPTKDGDEMGPYGYSVAQLIQLCASAMSASCWFDRNGVLQIVRFPWAYNTDKMYNISRDISYLHPEITLNKPVKNTKVSYYPTNGSSSSYEAELGLWENGETQTIDNPLVGSRDMAMNIANDTKYTLGYREEVTGEYRADPRLDVFDWVKVSSKYGDMDLVITKVKYAYTGCFHAEYTARMVGIPESL